MMQSKGMNMSKRNRKKRKQQKKDRGIINTIDMGEKVEAYISVDSKGKVSFLHNGVALEPRSVYVESSYERKKGLKILNRTPLIEPRIATDPNEALMKYEHIFAIDTNTKTIRNEKISVTCVVYCILSRISGRLKARYNPVFYIKFANAGKRAEKIGWMLAIKNILTNPKIAASQRIGVVVDSDLQNIPVFNRRDKAIDDNFYLPASFELVYASSDAGKEYLANKLISCCDTEANKALKNIKK